MPAYFLVKQCFSMIDMLLPASVFVFASWLLSFPDIPLLDLYILYLGLSIYCVSIGVVIGTLFSGWGCF